MGDLVAEFAFPEPDPPPVTTIAWRIAHLRPRGRTQTCPWPRFVLHINREVIHHGAEICLLRDLLRQRSERG